MLSIQEFGLNTKKSLAEKAFLLLGIYFGLACVIYYLEQEWPELLPQWLRLYVFQIYLFLALCILVVRGWRLKWSLSGKQSLMVLSLLASYVAVLKLFDFGFALAGYPALSTQLEWAWSTVLLQLVLAPFLEEIFFRDFIFRSFGLQMQNVWRALLFSSGFFMLAHLTLHPGAFLLGLVTCGLYLFFGSVVPCILFHFISNATLYFFPLFCPHLLSALREWGLYQYFYN